MTTDLIIHVLLLACIVALGGMCWTIFSAVRALGRGFIAHLEQHKKTKLQ